ncbi:MAG: YbhB/YbcL family Raf kinase inhibitor-like protein [Gemmatimonadales bacterium]
MLATSVALSRAEAQTTPAFTLTSSDVQQGRMLSSAQVFSGMGCTGRNVSPALAWQGAPTGTKSFAVTMYDPDAPTGSGWWHWVLYNIRPTVTSLPAGAGEAGKAHLADGAAQGNTDFGIPGYGGACPPPGDPPHHYHITIYALDVDTLDVPAGATAAYVGFNLHAHQLAKADLTALYGR